MADSWGVRNTFLVLLALEDGDKHGYEIASYTKTKTNGFFNISFGNLYPILHRLEKQGLIKGSWKDVGEKSKKVYSLTTKGHIELKEERSQYKVFVGAFSKLLEA